MYVLNLFYYRIFCKQIKNERGFYMKHRKLRRFLPAVLLVCTLSFTSLYANGAQSDIDNANDQIDNLQNQIEDAENQLDSYNEQNDALQGDLKDLNNNLQSLANDINELESQISEKEAEMSTLSGELEEATQLANEQYENMKSRIQFMYEHGNTSLLEILLDSQSFSDFLNRTEYVSFITSYDREKLSEYQQLMLDISEKKKQLEEGQATLLAMQEDMKQNQSNVSALISKTQQDIDKNEANISDANENLENLAEQLAYWEELEKKLEEEKAEADRKKWEEIHGKEEEDFSNIDYTPQEGEAYLLAAIIQCEAEGEPYNGKIAVGNVVLNRVASSSFPDTITGVIYQEKQFSPVASGRLAYRLEAGVNEECIKAANEVLAGQHITDALFFRTNNGSVSGTVIGNHVFY